MKVVRRVSVAALLTLTACGGSESAPSVDVAPSTHAELIDFWQEWREFERPAFDQPVVSNEARRSIQPPN